MNKYLLDTKSLENNINSTNTVSSFNNTVELAYNDLGLCDTSAITLYIPWYQLIARKARVSLPCLVRHTQEHLPRI